MKVGRRSSFAAIGLLSLAAIAVAACSSSPESSPAAGSCSGSVEPCAVVRGGSDAGVDASLASTADPGAEAQDATAADAATDARDPGAGAFPAPHPSVPQIVSLGGSTLAAPKVVAVTYANDDMATVSSIVDFTNRIGSSAYWAAVSEYGVGPLTAAAPVALAQAAPTIITDNDIQQLILAAVSAKDPAWPVLDANTIVALYLPLGTEVDSGDEVGCVDFGGYHSEVHVVTEGDLTIPYVVVPRCPQNGSTTVLDTLTSTASAALVSASTNPTPYTDPAFGAFDSDHVWWEARGADPGSAACQWLASASVTFPDLPYVVQRFWSNRAILAGHDVCVPSFPAAGDVGMYAAPVMPDAVSYESVATHAVQIPVGGSANVELDLFSDGPTSGPWTVAAYDDAAMSGHIADLTFALPTTSGQNGDKLTVTVTARNPHPASGGSLFWIISSLGGRGSLWYGLVTH